MQQEIKDKLAFQCRMEREKRKNLTVFARWVLLSENTMLISPLILAVGLDKNMQIIILVLCVLSLAVIAYSFRFYKHVRKPRMSVLFWKRKKTFARSFGFWFMFLISLLVVASNNASKMRTENILKSEQKHSRQKHIKVMNGQQSE